MAPPPPWRFRCYRSQSGIDQIKAWYDGQTVSVQAKFRSRLLALQGLPFAEWKEPLFKWLGNGIGEVRFKADGVQQRPLGFRGPGGPDVFTLAFPATERSDKFVPKDALERAAKLKAEVESDARRYSISCWLFEDPEPDVFEATSE